MKTDIAVKALLPNGNRPIFRTYMIGGLWTAVKESNDGEILCHLVKIRRNEEEPDSWEEYPAIRCELAPTHHVTLVSDMSSPPPPKKGLT